MALCTACRRPDGPERSPTGEDGEWLPALRHAASNGPGVALGGVQPRLPGDGVGLQFAAQMIERLMLGESYRDRGRTDNLRRVLDTKAEPDPENQDFALLVRERAQQLRQ